MRLVDLATPTPASPPVRGGSDVLQALSGVSFARILDVLHGALWRGLTAPFEITSWTQGTEVCSDPESAPLCGASVPGGDWLSVIYPPDRPIFEDAVAAFVSAPTEGAPPIDYRIIVGEGELVWLRQWLIEARPAQEGRHEVLGLVRIVSEEKRLQWEIMRTSESERSRLGQEIHDDVCQILAGISYLTHVLHQRLKPVQPAEAAELESINREIQAGLDRTRALAHGLLPCKSDFNTLSQAFRELARQVATRFGIQLTVKLPAKCPAYSRDHLLHLYRIVQEAASNSFKHGRATQIEVTLEPRGHAYLLTIEDNGSGLPAEAQQVAGVGLNVMGNRAELLGGRVSFGNSARGGARLEVHLPQSSDS